VNYGKVEHLNTRSEVFFKNIKYESKKVMMKKQLSISLVIFALLMTGNAFGQAFVESVEPESSQFFAYKECILKLVSGEEVHGKFYSGVFSGKGFTKITIQLENGEKAKYEADQIISMYVKAGELLKLSMITDAGSSIAEMANTDYNDIINREWVIFETALTPKKNDTKKLMQLLNAGFDSKIKVFDDPSAKTGGLAVGGIQVTGGEDKGYLFVKGGEKAIAVKKGSYAKDFVELFGDCPKMLEAYKNQKIKWDDVALHIFYYDQFCK
jgi:hypothetical protein